MTNSVDVIDNRASRYRQAQILRAFARYDKPPERPMPTTNRETPDANQVIGIPLFIMHTPAWRRQDWAQPQTPPSVHPDVA